MSSTRTYDECWDRFYAVAARAHANRCRREAAERERKQESVTED